MAVDKTKVYEIIAEELNVDKSTLNENTSFVNDLNADSLDIANLAMEFEDEFGVELPEGDANPINTIGDVFKLIDAAKK
ncbi:MAG: acyl carrier protein [Planctomycetota bacterium]